MSTKRGSQSLFGWNFAGVRRWIVVRIFCLTIFCAKVWVFLYEIGRDDIRWWRHLAGYISVLSTGLR